MQQSAEEGEHRLAKDALGGDLFGALLAELRFQLPVAQMAAAGIYGVDRSLPAPLLRCHLVLG